MNPETVETASVHAPQTIDILLSRLIDYAGLFPPAALDMLQAVANYDAYLRSEHSWMLGRFIVPAARLGEFTETLGRLTGGPSKMWEVSALLGGDPEADVARITAFNAGGSAIVKSVETKANSPDEVKQLTSFIPEEFEAYFEIPLAGRERECIAAVAQCGRRAKIRTGGETADKIPDPARVVEFVKLCADANVPFKATAGLHHALRSVHRLTYQADSASALMHGFLNVFLAAAFLRAGMDTRVAAELLEERSARAIQFSAEGVAWREYRLSLQAIAAARRNFSLSFGSCSFAEPIEDLRALGLL